MTVHIGAAVLTLVAAALVAAPALAPNSPDRRFPDLLYAPPSRIHFGDPVGGGGYIYAPRLVSRLERRFTDDPSRPVPLRWFDAGRVVTADPDAGAPLLLFGSDPYGRDVFSRLLHGGRMSLAVALLAALGSVVLGTLTGAVAGSSRSRAARVLGAASDAALVLPTMYVVLVVRGMLPLVMESAAVFATLTPLLALLGAPVVARGVRAIVVAERERDFAAAARALGASPLRIALRHLLPAALPYARAQLALLVPAFIVAEATLSFIGFGFPVDVPTWGTMLRDAENVSVVTAAPWLLAPAGAIFVVTLGVNLVIDGTAGRIRIRGAD